MLKSTRLRSVMAFGLAMVFIMMIICTSTTVAQTQPPAGIQELLTGITEEEKHVLQGLFTLAQEIEVMESAERNLTKEIEQTNQEFVGLEMTITEEEANYKKNQEALKSVYKIYQKMGPGSYLEIMMDSDNLSTFLRRLNTFRDLTRNTGRLLENLELSKNKLAAEKVKLSEKLVLIKENQAQSKEALAKKLKLKEEKEAYLAGLKEKSTLYQEYLTSLQTMVAELKTLLSKSAMELSKIITDGSLPRDTIKITFSLFNIKGTIDEKTFNEIMSKQPNLSKLVFAFNEDEIEISIPEKNLVLTGDFVIQEENKLSFCAEKGSFYGMPLEPKYIEELLSEGDLILDLKPLLGKNILQAIRLHEGTIELNIKPNLF